MQKCILNTRPQTDSGPLIAALHQRGYQTLDAPMLDIIFPDIPGGFDLAGVQALLFTSANGVRAFIAACDRRDLPVFAVGDATARLAIDAGFHTVHSAKGDVQTLAALVCERATPGDGLLFHPAARKTAGDLGNLLAGDGFKVRRQTCYEAQMATRLAPEIVAAFRNHKIDAALFFSPRTAESFVKLAQQEKIGAEMARVTAICLSQAVQDRLSLLTWQEVAIAAHPTQDELLLALDRAVA